MRGVKRNESSEHREAERALRHALMHAGTLVPGAAIAEVWHAANGAGPVPVEVEEGRWERVLRFAIAAGRVTKHRVPTHAGPLWGMPALEPLPVPERRRRPRVYGESLRQRAADVEVALHAAVTALGRYVTAAEIVAHAPTPLDLPLAGPPALRISRALEPSVAAGRVVAVTQTWRVLFAPAERADLPLPALLSDLQRVAEALQRAVARHEGAVPSSLVAAEVAADAELALRTSRISIAAYLHCLVRERRARRIARGGTVARRRYYFTTLEGPRHIPGALLTDVDRRRMAIRGLWRAIKGRPFTTAAVRRYAEARPGLTIPGDTPWAWTNALLHLARIGEVTAIRERGQRCRRWALRAEWDALSDAERAERLLDLYRHVAPGAVHIALPGTAPSHDPGWVSRAADVRTLVELAQCQAAATAETPEDADLMRARPVTLRQVRAAAAAAPHLLGHSVDVRFALREATRRRPGVKQPAVVQVGRVGRTTYVSTEPSEEATALIDLRAALRDWSRGGLARSAHRLDEAITWAVTGAFPVPSVALHAWCATLTRDAEDLAGQLAAASAGAQLVEDERRQVQEGADALAALRRALDELSRRIPAADADVTAAVPAERTSASTPVAAAIAAGEGESADSVVHARPAADGVQGDTSRHGDTRRLTPVPLLLDSAEAWRQIADVSTFSVRSPRQLTFWIARHVPIVRRPELDRTRGPREGRRLELYLDRPAFLAYVVARWGSAGWATIAAHGMHVLGDGRSDDLVRMLAAALLRGEGAGEDSRMRSGAAAALALLDIRAARGALTDFIDTALSREASGGAVAPISALTAAAYGLAHKPVAGHADQLADAERSALERLAHQRTGDYAGRTALRALASWDDEWSVTERLQL